MNRLFLPLFAVVLTTAQCAALAGAHGMIPGPAIDRLVEAVRAVLPQGWSASGDKENGWLNITRDQSVLVWYASAPNSPGPELDAAGNLKKRPPEQYSFNFAIVPKISPDDHQRLTGENAELEKLRKELFAPLAKISMGLSHDDFRPVTKEQKALVSRYKAVKNAQHRLPVFYFGDHIGLDWGWLSPVHANYHAEDETIRKECERVYEKVLHVFTKYPDDAVDAPWAPNLPQVPQVPD